MTAFEVLNERHFDLVVSDPFHFISLAFSPLIVLGADFVPTRLSVSIEDRPELRLVVECQNVFSSDQNRIKLR